MPQSCQYYCRPASWPTISWPTKLGITNSWFGTSAVQKCHNHLIIQVVSWLENNASYWLLVDINSTAVVGYEVWHAFLYLWNFGAFSLISLRKRVRTLAEIDRGRPSGHGRVEVWARSEQCVTRGVRFYAGLSALSNCCCFFLQKKSKSLTTAGFERTDQHN